MLKLSLCPDSRSVKKSTGSSPPLHMLSLCQALYLQWADAMVDKEPPNNQAMRKLPIPTLQTTAYTTKTSKQTSKDQWRKAAKKKELDWAALWGGALEASWSAAEREWGTWKLQSTLFSILPTQAVSTKSAVSKLSAKPRVFQSYFGRKLFLRWTLKVTHMTWAWHWTFQTQLVMLSRYRGSVFIC